MLMLNPGGGAMVLKSIGMFLERGRRGSMPQAHTLLHQASRRKVIPVEEPKEKHQTGNLGVYHLSPSEIIWSRKLKQNQREKFMAEDKKTGNKTQPKIIESLKKRTHFNRQEIEALCRIYRELVTSSSNVASKASATVPTPGIPALATKSEGLDRIIFRELVHNAFDLVTEEVLIDRIFCAFDRNNDGVIKLDSWVSEKWVGVEFTELIKSSTVMRSFCMSAGIITVYDLNADGFITRDEMMHLLRNCLMKSPQDEDPEEGVRDLVELALRKMDIDKDGKINYKDFHEAVTIEPLLLEAFGQCLPTEAACQAFMATLRG